MAIAQSKVTAQGQISVPAEVRRKLGLGPGSILEWDEADGNIVVRRAGSRTFEEIHKAVFPEGPPKRRSLKELKEGIKTAVRTKHARR
jgi:AbrB family looped-hinge helix DNA binding protein